jgi:transposase InsO family protein
VPAAFDAVAKKRLERDSLDYQLLPVTSSSSHKTALYYLPARPRRGLSSVIPITPRLVIPDGHFRRGLIQMFHDTPLGGHLGIKRTFRKLYGRYYWPSLLRDVESHVAACIPCNREKIRRRTLVVPAGLIPPPTMPFELISMDFIGPLTISEDARYVLVVVDHFTQFVIAIPTQTQSAPVAARALVEEVFCRYGIPKRILSDRGTAFRSEMLRQIHATLHVKQLFTSSHHPQCNGKVERLNSTLKEIIYALHEEFKGQWIQSLQFATFAYNTSVSEVTLHTPYYLLYGREAVSLGDLIGAEASTEVETATRDTYAEILRTDMLTAHNIVRSITDNKTLTINQKKMKLARIPTYQLGDLVALQDHRHAHASGDERAHVRPFTGPWLVQARLGETTYKLKPLAGSNARSDTTVHISRMKPWHAPSSATSSTDAAPKPPTVPFETPVSSGPIRIPSGRRHSGLGAVHPEDAHHFSANPREVWKAEEALAKDAAAAPEELARSYSPMSPVDPAAFSPDHPHSPVSPLLPPSIPDVEAFKPTEPLPPLEGPAGSALGHRRTGYRPDYSEKGNLEMERRPSHRYSLAPRAGLAPDASTKKKKHRKRKTTAT